MSRPRMLVVDDDDGVRIVTSEMLSRMDCDVEVVSSGKEALASVKDGVFDLIFLDVGMPVMTGIEVYRLIRIDFPAQKIVFMTGYTEEELSDLQNPNTWILAKPFTLKGLSNTLADVLS